MQDLNILIYGTYTYLSIKAEIRVNVMKLHAGMEVYSTYS